MSIRFCFSRSLRTRCVALSFLALICGAPPAIAESLTLADAQRLALQRSLQLRAPDHAGAAARDMAHAAGRLPDPVLRVGIDNLPLEGPDRFSTTRDNMTMRRVGVMQEFTRSEKRQARSERYLREADKAAAEKSMIAAAIERDATLAWLERYYLQQMLALLEEQLQQARLESQAADGAYRAGRGSQADLFAARGAMVEAEDRMHDVERRARAAATMLARWVGAAAELPLAGKPNIDTIRLDPATLDVQLAHHPEIAVLGKAEEIAQANVRIAQADRKSDWSAEVMLGQRPGYDNMISIGVSIPLQWDQRNRQDRELSARLAQAEQAQLEREEALRVHVADVRTLIIDWESSRTRAARIRKELQPLAGQRSAAALAAYRGGRGMLSEVLNARTAEIDARMQALQLDMDAARLWAQINYMTPGHEAVASDAGASQ